MSRLLAVLVIAAALGCQAQTPAASSGASGNVIWYTSAGAIQAADERELPDTCTIDSMKVLSTGYVFEVPGGMKASVAKNRPFDKPEVIENGWSIWSVAKVKRRTKEGR